MFSKRVIYTYRKLGGSGVCS